MTAGKCTLCLYSTSFSKIIMSLMKDHAGVLPQVCYHHDHFNKIIGPVTEPRMNGHNDQSIPKHIHKRIHLIYGSRESARLEEANHVFLSCKRLKKVPEKLSEATADPKSQRRSQSGHTVGKRTLSRQGLKNSHDSGGTMHVGAIISLTADEDD